MRNSPQGEKSTKLKNLKIAFKEIKLSLFLNTKVVGCMHVCVFAPKIKFSRKICICILSMIMTLFLGFFPGIYSSHGPVRPYMPNHMHPGIDI